MHDMASNTGVLDGKTIRVEAPAVSRRQGKNAGAKERLKKIETKAFSETKNIPGVSVFAVFGTMIIAVLMVFVVLAQIYYNETASEAAKLSREVRELSERHRILELTFESSFDIREVERIAKDELGMSRPEASQIVTISSTPYDTATVIIGEDEGSGQGFLDFLRSLTNYFRR